MKIVIIVPCFNAERNLENLRLSLEEQTDNRWQCIFINDISSDNTQNKIDQICKNNSKFSSINNVEKKYALRNIVEQSREYENSENIAIGVIDGDDQLCNPRAIEYVLKAYENGEDVVWTAHKWDINGMNISKSIPSSIDPYHWPWCSSHFRTFRSCLLKNINDKNFKNPWGKWFKRGYDQALMLPLLYLTDKRCYIEEVCYLYNIESVSVNDRDWAEHSQLSTINLVRARGFLR
jgi:glycosyltransferase involved in cell wall biosynthesis